MGRGVIIQPINDFRDEYIAPINSGSFKAHSLTPYTFSNSKLSFFLFFENLYSVPEFWAFVDKNKKQKNKSFNFNFVINPSIHLYKHTIHEIVC